MKRAYAIHINDHMIAKQIVRVRYYYSFMQIDYINYMRMWHKCQIYIYKFYTSSTLLNNLIASWPFSIQAWMLLNISL